MAHDLVGWRDRWLAVPAVVATLAGGWHVWEFTHLLTTGSQMRWIVSGAVALVALVATLVALARVPGPRMPWVVLAAVGSFVCGATLLLDLATVLFFQWLAGGLSAPHR
jgi:hypothetical protein